MTARSKPAHGKYFFEDFLPGSSREIVGPTITKDMIVEFASRYDPQYYHVDENAAALSPYGGLIASGWMTVCLCMRLICDLYLVKTVSLGSPGVKDIRWIRPVRPGDRLRLKMTVVEARISRSRPDRGTITNRWEVFNQKSELVMTVEGYGIYARRPQEGKA